MKFQPCTSEGSGAWSWLSFPDVNITFGMTHTTWTRNCFTLWGFLTFSKMTAAVCGFKPFFAELMELNLSGYNKEQHFLPWNNQEGGEGSVQAAPSHPHPSSCQGEQGKGSGMFPGLSSPSTFCTCPKHLSSCIHSTQWCNKEFHLGGEEIHTAAIRWVSVRSCIPLKEAWKLWKISHLNFHAHCLLPVGAVFFFSTQEVWPMLALSTFYFSSERFCVFFEHSWP